VRPKLLCQGINSSDTIGNRTRDVPVCSVVPQPTTPPRAPQRMWREGICGCSDQTVVIMRDTLKMIYYAYFHAIMRYGLIFWGKSSHSGNIFKLQKRIIRIVMGARPRDFCRELFKVLKILPLILFQIPYCLLMTLVSSFLKITVMILNRNLIVFCPICINGLMLIIWL
jgi:hypothetical protein